MIKPVIGSLHRFGASLEAGCVQWLEGDYVVPCMRAIIGPAQYLRHLAVVLRHS